MKLFEFNLDGYKHILKNDWNLPKNLIEFLKQYGFNKIGKGHYSEIYSSNFDDFVIKINNSKNFDENYIKFVEFCQKNNSKHLPKMGKIKKYENWFIIFIEKLEPIDRNMFGLNYAYFSKFMNILIRIYNESDNPIQAKDNMYKKYKDIFDFMGEEYSNQIYDIISLMSKFKKEINADYLDLNIDNIMKRKDGTLVIIDPAI